MSLPYTGHENHGGNLKLSLLNRFQKGLWRSVLILKTGNRGRCNRDRSRSDESDSSKRCEKVEVGSMPFEACIIACPALHRA